MDLGAKLKGKRVLITGASGGIGAHLARVSARCGARVAIAARRQDKLEELAKELLDLGAERALVSFLDVSEEESVEACLSGVVAAFDGLDVLVNNAGVARDAMALDQNAEDFDAVLDVNLRGVWLMATAAGRHWRASGTPGSIINIASILSERVAKAVAAYAVSKAGVVQMTKALALELARHDIRVNAIEPGYFATEINAGFFETPAGETMIKRIPMRRIGAMDELDGPFLLLATDASRFMTGAAIPVDGGHLVSSL
ncbi:SDR family oxidoreductase [Stappia sp. F7233]|uniref:SDR family oxidoreductase n=1 Tax=Stappia albiluteola TaxID=2758565 RepID=A0A839ADD2_9HYPH|nr:SDR family NAD(P)-dependent oxidoreductase [Stappia albiluteola]MBA5777038.1 SDR family oxidoreductase [Stappia albiluteola]